mmetsp:Transcript_16840/g.43454  ORF Transcript_16840/g.43454 Transcript_16840/m.43454 type:complete len:403 (-) Transcript_16840:49-1257(-)
MHQSSLYVVFSLILAASFGSASQEAACAAKDAVVAEEESDVASALQTLQKHAAITSKKLQPTPAHGQPNSTALNAREAPAHGQQNGSKPVLSQMPAHAQQNSTKPVQHPSPAHQAPAHVQTKKATMAETQSNTSKAQEDLPSLTGALGSANHDHDYDRVFWKSLLLVGVAELFDKTWFMGLILALKYPAGLVFAGSFMALFLHVFLAAAFGLAFARFLSPTVLNFSTAALFAMFAVLYAKDWYDADPEGDAIAAGRAEAEEDCGIDVPEQVPEPNMEKDLKKDHDVIRKQEAVSFSAREVLGKSFMGVFIAEWGDRTQIAMVGQHASQPLVPVFLGSTVAFFLLTASAVGVASVSKNLQLRERLVYGVSAVFFTIFALLAVKDAIEAMAHDSTAIVSRAAVA